MEVGNYSVKIPVQDMNKKIWVTQTAPNREESDRQEKVVKGVPAPKPNINEMDTDDTRVTRKRCTKLKSICKNTRKSRKTCRCKWKWRLVFRYRTIKWWTRNNSTSRITKKTK